MLKIGIILATFLTMNCYADVNYQGTPVDSSNEIQSAIQKSIVKLHNSGCIFPYVHRLSTYDSYTSTDSKQYDIVTVVRVECKEWVTKDITYVISWEPPTTREDGSALNQNEIDGYQIMNGSSVITLVTGTTYTIINPPVDLGIRTKDINGIVSKTVKINLGT